MAKRTGMKRKAVSALSGVQRPRTPYTVLRAKTVPDGRKEAARLACRGGYSTSRV